ncbi:GcrA cell cycle regulator [Phenylobacterium sp. LjRoot219]|uniref:GcrA family cell cycle regulator n=1 Tax=Phenylobacterium sp. LjRoot219 TaxID=3342283 RepID=UPI003ECE6664
MTSLGWTDDRVATLKRLWIDGLSASQVAARLGGGVSRSAVIGKLHRLGLTGPRIAAVRPAPKQRPAKRSPAAPSRWALRSHGRPTAQTPEPVVVEHGLVRNLRSLGRGDCRWPLGDPQAADFSFCGRPARPGSPYCASHNRAAHAPRTATQRDSAAESRRQPA